MTLLVSFLEWIKEAPEHFKTQEICDEEVLTEPYTLCYVPEHFKIEGTSREASTLGYIPYYLKRQ